MTPMLRLVKANGPPPSPLQAARDRARRAVQEYLRLAMESDDHVACDDAMGLVRRMTEAET